MAGIKFPVVENEKLMIKQGGRGIYMYSGGTTTNCANLAGGWSAYFNPSTSITSKAYKLLPAASATAWFKFNVDGTDYYAPGFTNLHGIS